MDARDHPPGRPKAASPPATAPTGNEQTIRAILRAKQHDQVVSMLERLLAHPNQDLLVKACGLVSPRMFPAGPITDHAAARLALAWARAPGNFARKRQDFMWLMAALGQPDPVRPTSRLPAWMDVPAMARAALACDNVAVFQVMADWPAMDRALFAGARGCEDILVQSFGLHAPSCTRYLVSHHYQPLSSNRPQPPWRPESLDVLHSCAVRAAFEMEVGSPRPGDASQTLAGILLEFTPPMTPLDRDEYHQAIALALLPACNALAGQYLDYLRKHDIKPGIGLLAGRWSWLKMMMCGTTSYPGPLAKPPSSRLATCGPG